MHAGRRFLIVITCLLACLLAACGSESPKLKPLSRNDVIVAFGDSLTAGNGAKPGEAYPEQLARITGMRVVNAGVPGEETTDGLKRIRQVLREYHPKLVILCLGGNDQIHKRDPRMIKANLEEMIMIIRGTGAEVLLLATPRPSLSLAVPEYYAEVGKEFVIPVDEVTLPELLGQPDKKSDYIHLNADGYKELAEAVASRLREAGAL